MGDGISSVAVEGGLVETVAGVGDPNDRINSIAADATGVYWTRNYTGSIVRLSAAGTQTIAVGENRPTAITLDATSVYWVAGAHAIVRAPK